MIRNWLPRFPLIILLVLLPVATLLASSPTRALVQQQVETPPSGLYITVVTDEPQINVRLGPSSTVYPIVGVLITGSTAPALGRSAGGDWVQIEFPSAPGGKGWVYSPLVQVSSPGNLQIVDAPPTPLPPATSTIDPTLAAQFVILPTNTRMPTFTPPPTLQPIEYTTNSTGLSSIPWAAMIIAFAVLGAVGFILSVLIRR